jgi:cell division septation protein DedD
MLVNSSDIQVMEDLNRRFRGWYMIHISSFQTSVRARDEVAFLESHEFPVFIVFLDLGPKGKWYRVYAGPFQTRDEAENVKKNLDAVPQVRFTRIATIPD